MRHVAVARQSPVLSPALRKVKRDLPIGKRIVWARKRLGISQERLAGMIGTSRRHMIRIETGDVRQPGREFVARIAAATDCPEELFQDDPEESRAVSLEDFLRQQVRTFLREEAESFA